MLFIDWKQKYKKTNKEISEVLNVSEVTVSRWLRSKKTPNLMNIYAIQKMTNGEVTASDFIKKGDTNG